MPGLLPSVTPRVLTCGRADFKEILHEFELERGVQPLLDEGRSPKAVKQIVKAFEVLLIARFQCIDANKNLESRKLHGAFSILIASLNGRVKTELKF